MRMHRASTFGVVAALLLVGGAVSAQNTIDDATRSSARRIGDEAKELFDAGDFAGALDKYERIETLVRVPGVGLRAARCLVKLGRLIEASERYLAVTRMQLASDALPVHKEAQAQAEAERAALLPRIPSVVITVTGAPDADVTIDGKPVPKALLGASRAIDPGAHKIEARRGADVQTRDIHAGEGENMRVSLAFAGESSPATLAAAAPRDPGASDRTTGPSMQRTLGWVGLGLGAVGLGVGAIAGLSAMSKKSDLEAQGACGPDLRCPSALASDADSYNVSRHLSTAGFVAGSVLAAAGAALLIASPDGSRSRASARATPWLGWASVGVSGKF